ncbi:hypothetical protein Tco_1496795 [Tanacetum coccineum]
MLEKLIHQENRSNLPSDKRNKAQLQFHLLVMTEKGMKEATLLSLTLHKNSSAVEAQENVAKLQEKLAEEEIGKMVEGEEDEESYSIEFTDSMLNDDDDDSVEKKDEDDKKDGDVNKTNDAAEEKDKMIILIIRWSELMQRVQLLPHPRPKFREDLLQTRPRFFQEELLACIQEVLDHCNNVVPEMTFAKTNAMINEEMPYLVNLAINKDQEIVPINVPQLISKEFSTHGPKMIEELFRQHMQNTTLNLYPTTSSSTAETLTADL